MSRETIMIIFQPGYWRTWTNHISVWHYVASLATDNVNLLLKCYSRSRTSILRIVTSSVFTWICMLSLLVCVLTYHISSLDSAQANDTVSSQETRSFSTLHSWHFYVSDCTIYYWCGWWQLWSSVLKLRSRSELVWLWLGQCPHHAPRHAT